ncbi:MAG TPA: PIN domain-containing protein [Longimicrobium sp.]
MTETRESSPATSGAQSPKKRDNVDRGDSRIKLQTKNVFVDTNIHVAAKFAYAQGSLARLANVGNASIATVFDTSVDRGEILSNMKDLAQDASDALKKFTRTAPSLAASTDPAIAALFQGPDATRIEAIGHGEYTAFRARAKARDLPLAEKAVHDIFSRYFDRLAPFSEKKRSEFPDAFIVATLSEWCWREAELMYVVSADSGFREAALAMGRGRLIPLERLEEFLDLVVSAEDEPAAAVAQYWVDSHRQTISRAISEVFATNTGFWVSDADGEVFDVEIEELELRTPLLVEADEAEAVFDIPFEVTFTAEIDYEVPGTGVYDSEDKVMLFADRARMRVRRTDDHTAEVRLQVIQRDSRVELRGAAQEFVMIGAVSIDRSRDLPVSIDDERVHVFPVPDDEDRWYVADYPGSDVTEEDERF